MSTFTIRGATVVDGTGARPLRSDVVVVDGIIAEAGRVPAAGPVFDAEGLILAPGFIDLHAHSDLTRFAYPDGDTRVLQGITTEVIGNCGLSPAPVAPGDSGFRDSIATIDVAPWVEFSWSSPAEYLDALDAFAASSNVAPLLGHGGVRRLVLGDRPDTATAAERDRMADVVHEALAAGYWGLSLGLMYAPGELSDTAELEALAAVVAAHGALLTAHMRAYDEVGLVPAVREVLELAERSGAALEISHLRSIADPSGVALTGALALLAASTVDVSADAYPYLAGHTTTVLLLPPDLRARGVEAVLRAIERDRDGVAADLRATSMFGPEAITIARAGGANAPEVGRMLADLAQSDARGRDWALLLVDLLSEHAGAVDAIVVGTRPEDAARVLREPIVSVASDGVALGLDHRANLPHPRSIGTFPRALRELLDAGLPIEQVVHKMTGKPARRLGLAGRGTIAPGAVADLTLFDPDRVRDNATYADPLVPPSGIVAVWVAGEHVVDDGAVTGRRPGRLLRRSAGSA